MMRSGMWAAFVALALVTASGAASADDHAGDNVKSLVKNARTGGRELANSISKGSEILLNDAQKKGSKAADSAAKAARGVGDNASKAAREVGDSASKGGTTLWHDVGAWFHSVFSNDGKNKTPASGK